DVFTEVDRPHAAAAEAFQNAVLAQREAAPPAAQELVTLEMGQQAFGDEEPGQAFRVFGEGRIFLEEGVQAVRAHDTAFAQQFHEVFASCRRWHRSSFHGGRAGSPTRFDINNEAIARPLNLQGFPRPWASRKRTYGGGRMRWRDDDDRDDTDLQDLRTSDGDE